MSSPKRLQQSIINILDLLTSSNLLLHPNIVMLEQDGQSVRIGWPNHQSGRFNCSENFGKLIQYRGILSANAYTCILYDGSIVRVSYTFKTGELTSYSLLWWPSPIQIDSDYYNLGGILEVFDLHISSPDWQNNIIMRSPVRFDFDVENITDLHPASHVHIQDCGCRLFANRIICFGRFIKFIFKHFHPDVYVKHILWRDIEDIDFRFDLPKGALIPNHEYLGWAE